MVGFQHTVNYDAELMRIMYDLRPGLRWEHRAGAKGEKNGEFAGIYAEENLGIGLIWCLK